MNGVIDWQGRAIDTLRQRVVAAEAERSDLLAYAHGHAGATAAIHASLLALAAADDRAMLVRTVVADWPALLGLDQIVLALGDAAGAERTGADGTRPLEPRLLERYVGEANGVTMRCVARGHALFGETAAGVRSEALVGFRGRAGTRGLLLMAQGSSLGFGCDESGALLGFLGQMLCAMLERCRPR